MAKESENGEERTEQPTAKRLQEARNKGQVAKSQEVSTALLFAGTVVTFYFYIPSVGRDLAALTSTFLGNASGWDGSRAGLVQIFGYAITESSSMLLPIFLAFVVIGFISNVMQIGINFSAESMEPKLSKLDPIKGFKNKFFSIKMVEMFVKNVLIILLIGFVAYRAIKRELPVFPPLIDAEPSVIVLTIFRSSLHLIWDALLGFIVIAVADWSFQKWQHTQDLLMTKQEIKDESKMTDGNPQIKSRIRSIQLQMARKRMMAEVPKADVVITNPTHLAIAIKYERGVMDAPIVIAKGAGPLAAKIREVARENRVPIVENKPLARAMYRAIEVGEAIPEDMFKAVAEILAYVYRLKKGAA